jgi:hypothetical protein
MHGNPRRLRRRSKDSVAPGIIRGNNDRSLAEGACTGATIVPMHLDARHSAAFKVKPETSFHALYAENEFCGFNELGKTVSFRRDLVMSQWSPCRKEGGFNVKGPVIHFAAETDSLSGISPFEVTEYFTSGTCVGNPAWIQMSKF